jgi:hypothetical protein
MSKDELKTAKKSKPKSLGPDPILVLFSSSVFYHFMPQFYTTSSIKLSCCPHASSNPSTSPMTVARSYPAARSALTVSWMQPNGGQSVTTYIAWWWADPILQSFMHAPRPGPWVPPPGAHPPFGGRRGGGSCWGVVELSSVNQGYGSLAPQKRRSKSSHLMVQLSMCVTLGAASLRLPLPRRRRC